MVIRPATMDDLGAVTACVQAAYVGYVVRIGQPPRPMLDDYAARIGQGVVYVLGDDIVQGLVVTWPEDDCQYLDNIAVDPAYQRQGLGKQLMAFVEDQARQGGLTAVCLFTHELMTENRALYARLG